MSRTLFAASRVGSPTRRSEPIRLALVLALAVLAACTSEERDAGPIIGDPSHRALLGHLASWHTCHAERLLDPSQSCAPIAPPPAELADLATQLRALTGLERHATYFADEGGAPPSTAACLTAISHEVQAIAVSRMRGREPAPVWQWSSYAGDCEGAVMAGLPDGDAAIEFSRTCVHAFDADGRASSDELGSCIGTITYARLAEAGVGPPLRRPHIVVILVDDQRWDTIDATHSPMPSIGMPAMPATYGRLAREGLTFTQAVVTTPVCGPSRGSFFTGLSTHRHGMTANGGEFGPARFDDSDTWATRLDDAGYRTGFLGKYTNGFTDLWSSEGEEPVIPPGWDDFRAFNHAQSVPHFGFEMVENGEIVSYDIEGTPYATDVLALHALHFIERSIEDSPDEPFALWISTTTPHYPWKPAPRHVGAFDRYELVLLPSTYEEDVSDKPLFIQSRRLPEPIDLLGQKVFRRVQLEMQLSTDEMVALLLDHLESLGIGDDTIILYTSDNGHAWADHRWNSKGCPWEACLRVPMLVRYPRLVPGPRTVDGLVANVDVLPTLLRLAGGAHADDIDGIDLSDVVRGVADVPERDVLFESYNGDDLTYAGIRSDHLKYVLYENGGLALYDLEADPWELENFIFDPSYQPIVEAMHTRLLDVWPGFDAALDP